MSGHNKWSSIKHKKGAADAKRGKVFTKLSKEITVSARMGGGDPTGNPRLRLAIAAAKAASMPSDNISRAIKKGTGELEGGQIEELVYEAYAPGGIGLIIEVATDNQNRTISDVRNVLDKAGGNLAKSGSVARIFQRRGMIRFDGARFAEDKVMEAALDAGAEDVVTEGDHVVVYTTVGDLNTVKEAMEAKGMEIIAAESTMIPSTTVKCDVELAKKTLKLIEKIEDHDDVQNVFGNHEIPDDVMEQLGEG
ncbi:YebC/PmpR family DNA-binding transcriptional regulator [Myxococcota bacterium]|nr:YebC/PmpR family DNA-binding transcriptional regulator [Myxococcota bacterium]